MQIKKFALSLIYLIRGQNKILNRKTVLSWSVSKMLENITEFKDLDHGISRLREIMGKCSDSDINPEVMKSIKEQYGKEDHDKKGHGKEKIPFQEYCKNPDVQIKECHNAKTTASLITNFDFLDRTMPIGDKERYSRVDTTPYSKFH